MKDHRVIFSGIDGTLPDSALRITLRAPGTLNRLRKEAGTGVIPECIGCSSDPVEIWALCRLTKIGPERCIAFGDHRNNMTMPEAVRRMFPRVTAGHDSDGIAEALVKFEQDHSKEELNMSETFRPLRRTKNAIPDEDARKLLETCKRGVLAVNGDNGYPFAFPIDFYYDREAGKIFFHGAKTGHKVDALRRDDRVCFTVYGNEHPSADWAPYVQSAVVYGRCRLVEDRAETEAQIRRLALKYYPTAEEVEEEIARDSGRVQLYEITIEHMTGKQIHEK